MKLVAVVLAVLALPCAAQAQELAPPPHRAWGTAWSSITPVNAWSFQGPLTDAGNGYRRCSVAADVCRAPVYLIGGTFTWAIDLEACDSSVTSEAVARLWACGAPGTCTIVGEVHSGIAAAPGCDRFFQDLPYPYLQGQNWSHTYFVDVFGTDGTNNVPVDFRNVRFASVRQVSQPPAVATFSDVPTSHPYFRHIEALADSRITAGCGNGQFCPDRPLTRGEMAVFLAEALGLNFLE